MARCWNTPKNGEIKSRAIRKAISSEKGERYSRITHNSIAGHVYHLSKPVTTSSSMETVGYITLWYALNVGYNIYNKVRRPCGRANQDA